MSARSSQSIFVCYRRIDSADAVDRIYEVLEKGLSRRGLFRDIDSMPYGIDFPSYIAQTLETCNVVLVVIGPAWLDARSENGSRRLDDPRDHVRLEIATALRVKGLRVIPVLVRNASMPTAEQLPDSIQELAGRSGLSVRPGVDFSNDMSRLVKHLRLTISEVRQLRSQQIRLSGVRDKVAVAWRNAKRFRRGVQIFGVLLVLLVLGTVYYCSSNPESKPSPTPTPLTEGKVPPAVQALIEQLKDADADARHAAATSLGKMGANAKGAMPALIQRVADDVWGSQGNSVNTDNAQGNTSKDAALKALKQLAPDRVEEALIEGMKSTSPRTRQWASAQLAANPEPKPSPTPTPLTKGKVPPAVQALIEQLKDGDADARHAAATSLGKMGANAKGAVPALIQRVADDVWGSQGNSVNTDNAQGNTSKDAALKALKQLAPDRVEEALIEGMKSTSPRTRQWASAQLAANP
jgi:HEAT repeat protein